jgi:hypothetical protein
MEGTGTASGNEWYEEADLVLDATGVYGQPNSLGRSGLPVPGEEAARAGLLYGLPDLRGSERDRVAARDVLVVGGGLSAATSVSALSEVGARSVVWVTRSEAPPIEEIADDPLPARLALAKKANALAAGEGGGIRHVGGAEVVSVVCAGSRYFVEIAPIAMPAPTPTPARVAAFASAPRGTVERPFQVEVDTIVVQTGFRPDNRIYRELQMHECYASQGPMNLAAALLGAGGGDCMTQSGHGPQSLTSPEPDFFLIGNKSYGRNSSFLLRIGREQVRDVFRLVTGDPELDLD